MLINKLFAVGDDIIKYQGMIRKLWSKDPKNVTLTDYSLMRCLFDDDLILFFNVMHGKLAQICYRNHYKDEIIKGVRLGMTIKSIADNYRLTYDDFENFYTPNGHEQVALFFENPYQSIAENSENKLEEVTITDQKLLTAYDSTWVDPFEAILLS